jgi:hypothetical protein
VVSCLVSDQSVGFSAVSLDLLRPNDIILDNFILPEVGPIGLNLREDMFH